MPERIDLGHMAYEDALAIQKRRQDELIKARGIPGGPPGTIYLVEHPPTITVTHRPGAAAHVLADEHRLRALGVRVCPTDRGGDVTYHGPGQVVAYPILDLERLAHAGKPLGLHGYMRLLEQAVIDTLAHWGVQGQRDPSATGVWVGTGPAQAKIAAMGVRVRKWVTTHGLALNVDCDLSHFGLIVPCGLARPVTSLREILDGKCPKPAEVGRVLGGHLQKLVREAGAGKNPTSPSRERGFS